MVGDVGNRGGYPCVGAGDIWKISVPSAQFHCELIIVLTKSTKMIEHLPSYRCVG